jgi:hypothetical protein
MDHSWIEKIVTGLVVAGVVILAIIRAGAGTAAVAGLGHIPMSMIPTRLRRFIFGERNDTAYKPNNKLA